MISLFVSIKALDTIALKNRWYTIICRDVKDINVYATDDELKKYLNKDTSEDPIANLVQSGDITLSSSIATIDGILNNPSSILDYPSGIFFLDIPKDKAENIQKNYGVIFKNENDIDDTELNESREIFCCEKSEDHNWGEFLKEIKESPTNSLIINDRYIFVSDTGFKNGDKRFGIDNLLKIIDSILPNSFSSDAEYHILLIYSKRNANNECRINFHELAENLSREIKSLRTYSINIEILNISSGLKYYEITHNRRIITNYHVIRAEHKFNAFNRGKSNCSQALNWDMLFSKGILDHSDVPYKMQKTLIEDLVKVSEYRSMESHTCQYEYSLNGEFIKDVQKSIFSKITNRLIVNN